MSASVLDACVQPKGVMGSPMLSSAAMQGLSKQAAERRLSRLGLCAAVALSACGTAAPSREAPPRATAVEPTAAVSPTASASSVPPVASAQTSVAVPLVLPPLPPGIELSGPRACKLQSASFRSGRSSTVLRLTEGGPIFARFDSGGASLSIPTGKAGSALLETSAEGVVARGFVDVSSIELRPARAFVMAGFVVPSATATLSFTSAKEDALTIALKPSPGVIVSKKLIEEERPCADVGFDSAKYETKTPVFGTRSGSTMLIRRGPVALMLKPSDKTPVATLSVPADRDVVQRYFVEKDRSLISWEAEDMLVFGWVSSVALHEFGGGQGSIGRLGGFGRTGPARGTPVARLQCDEDVPVIAQVKDVERTIGQVARGTVIQVLEWGGERTRIELFTKSLSPDVAARFFARTPELERCKKLPGV